MVEPIETLIGGLLGGVFGSPLMMGVMGLLMLIVLGVALRLSIEGFLVTLLPLTLIMAFTGALPIEVGYGLIIVCAFIIFIALARLINR
jgi:hypothetical protein